MTPALEDIISRLNAENKPPLIVGGAVRDALLGKQPKDIDIEVYNTTFDELSTILANCPTVSKMNLVGKKFGIIKVVDIDGNDYDFSIPRRDSKVGIGHKGFKTEFDKSITPQEAASRRDFTFNALAYDPQRQLIHDYYNGREDLENKILRHTSEAFAEDPLRVIRGLQFTGRMNLTIAPETAAISRRMIDDYTKMRPKMMQDYVNGGRDLMIQDYLDERANRIQDYLEENPGATEKEITKRFPNQADKKFPENPELFFATDIHKSLALERIMEEWMKLAVKSRYPGSALQYLKDTGWIQFYPEIENIMDVPQDPVWHPEGWITTPVDLHEYKSILGQSMPIETLTKELLINVLNKRHATKQNRYIKFASKSIEVFFEMPIRRVISIMTDAKAERQAVMGLIEAAAVHLMNSLAYDPSNPLGHEHLENKVQIINPKFNINGDDVVFSFGLIFNENIENLQESYHVKFGDVGLHTSLVMNEAARIADRDGLSGDDRAVLVFSALGHDLAKAYPENEGTTVLREKQGHYRWTSHGHEEASGPLVEKFLKNIGVKNDIIRRVRPLVERHLAHIQYKPGTTNMSQIRKLADEIYPATIEDLYRLMEADHSGRHPLPKGNAPTADIMLDMARRDKSNLGRPEPLIKGSDIMPYFNYKGGPYIGEIEKAAYKAQLEGRINNKEESIIWLRNYIKNIAGLIKSEHILPYYENKPGKHVGDALNAAWQAQLEQKFNDLPGAQQWLAEYINGQTPKKAPDEIPNKLD